MTKHDLKELAAMGAELGAAKAEIQTLRTALLAIDQRNDNPARFDQEIDKIVRAALSRQAEPVCQTMQRPKAECGCPDCGSSLIDWPTAEPTDTYTAVDMATAAAQGFRDGQAAGGQAPAQDEREAFKRALHSQKVFKLSSATIDAAEWAWFSRPAQTAPQQNVDAGLLGRIDAAIKAFTSGKASMHVPPEPTDVDMVLGECWQLVKGIIAAPQPEQSGLPDPRQWTDQQVLDFLGVALRNVDVVGTVQLNEIRQGFELVMGRAALSAQGAGDADS